MNKKIGNLKSVFGLFFESNKSILLLSFPEICNEDLSEISLFSNI